MPTWRHWSIRWHIRVAILALDARITERIKWNAPSFCRNDDDRLTFNLRHPNRIQLILHRGAKVKDTTDVHFSDDSGLVTWAAPDRGIVTMTSPAEATTHHHDLLALVRRWLDATAT